MTQAENEAPAARQAREEPKRASQRAVCGTAEIVALAIGLSRAIFFASPLPELNELRAPRFMGIVSCPDEVADSWLGEPPEFALARPAARADAGCGVHLPFAGSLALRH